MPGSLSSPEACWSLPCLSGPGTASSHQPHPRPVPVRQQVQCIQPEAGAGFLQRPHTSINLHPRKLGSGTENYQSTVRSQRITKGFLINVWSGVELLIPLGLESSHCCSASPLRDQTPWPQLDGHLNHLSQGTRVLLIRLMKSLTGPSENSPGNGLQSPQPGSNQSRG